MDIVHVLLIVLHIQHVIVIQIKHMVVIQLTGVILTANHRYTVSVTNLPQRTLIVVTVSLLLSIQEVPAGATVPVMSIVEMGFVLVIVSVIFGVILMN